MSTPIKPAKWADPAKKLFPHQVGFTAPPHDVDAAPGFRRRHRHLRPKDIVEIRDARNDAVGHRLERLAGAGP